MAQPLTPEAHGEWLPQYDLEGPAEQSRATVFFRVLLAIPHFIVLIFVAIAANLALIAGWFAALFTGRLPQGIADFLTGYLAWSTRLNSYVYLMIDDYPPFSLEAHAYPVRIEVRPGELNRLAVLFRIFLMIPAVIVLNVVASGWAFAGFVIWLVVLVKGRMPQALFEATAAVLRYTTRFGAYGMMLSSAYPKGLFGDEEGSGPRVTSTRPLVLGPPARNLVILFIVLGVLSTIYDNYSRFQG
ncbi:DUF4389 domain-containing protein [Actinomadura macrotermitis]|uniref:DUF4389 domain-containing protein n=1 Tax=Actinomadura macrotermitis TaxID=2585200 RepID=A0A7K0BPP3_9ACTN|nr:DUF4389 domain-containing protein [Actinomadura macrotermitis]MQY02674.1 hypothetical protein [Actinomadura macrotermitis]